MSKMALILFQTYNNIYGVLKPSVYNCASEKEWSGLVWFQKSLIYLTLLLALALLYQSYT